MEIVFSDHARRQLRERKLSENQVERTIRNPHKLTQQSPSRYRAVRRIQKQRKRYLLVVIYDAKNSIKEVVTAFLTTKFKKYL